MHSLIEPFIIYAVLFFPDVSAFTGLPVPAETVSSLPFDLTGELERIFLYNVPSLLLLWYVIFARTGRTGPGRMAGTGIPKIAAADIQAFFISLPGLLGIGLLVSLISPLFPEGASTFTLETPRGLAAWAAVILSCITTGYLEETYFRAYLLSRFVPAAEAGRPGGTRPVLPPVPRSVITVGCSTALFALCHLYEGPGGILNAFLAGLLLALVYLRCRALHGIAWAHGVYNALVYLVGV
ncbi:MAG: CPBP family intramembrane metalloprotease [Spirochaetaceae bacterium]|jgi:membrane protease YdiL (CAAX protease family)|nr:CPBP family intramembrane metalloprotease [Spirochaetaceae bacterium]